MEKTAFLEPKPEILCEEEIFCRICSLTIQELDVSVCSINPEITQALEYVLLDRFPRIILSSETLPKWFCQKCVNDLMISYEFIKRANHAYTKYKKNFFIPPSKQKLISMKEPALQTYRRAQPSNSKVNYARAAFKARLAHVARGSAPADPLALPVKKAIRKSKQSTSLTSNKKAKFTCCRLQFFTVNELENHLEENHPERIKVEPDIPDLIETFDCEVCHRKFTTAEFLVKHVQLHHSRIQKIFTCIECEKVFHSKRSLQLHANTHKVEVKIEDIETVEILSE